MAADSLLQFSDPHNLWRTYWDEVDSPEAQQKLAQAREQVGKLKAVVKQLENQARAASVEKLGNLGDL